jgi:hypothetical protein
MVGARRNQHDSSEHVASTCHPGIEQSRPFDHQLDKARYQNAPSIPRLLLGRDRTFTVSDRRVGSAGLRLVFIGLVFDLEGTSSGPPLAAVRSRPNWICRNASFVAGLADKWRIGTATLAKNLTTGRKLCGVSLWRGTLWRGSQEPRETRLNEAGTERRQSALRSLAYLRVGFGER